MSVTALVRPLFARHYDRVSRMQEHAIDSQKNLLNQLIKSATPTKWGASHDYKSIKNYDDFSKKVGINSYEELKGYIDRMRRGEKDLLWPGRVKWYAKSSGTTNDKSKFLPVSKQFLHDTHYMGGQDAVAYYLHQVKDSRLFDGKALILGGSHEPNYNLPQSLVGDLSAILIENINPLVNLVREPSKKIALISDFEQKRKLIAQITQNKNITNLSGVPSWMLSVINELLHITGKQHLTDIWPNLEVFFHGGVAFTPYRQNYHEIIPSASMHYMETYNASEGFFGLQTDMKEPDMELMTHMGVFFEFVPLEEVGKEHPKVLPLWEVETGKNYAMVISTTAGLWRYQIGDTIMFSSIKPFRFHITGRTKSFINAFGEELIVDNAEMGLAEACKQCNAEVHEYTAAPIFMDKNAKCRHQWVIEFSQRPDSLEHFAEVLDTTLQSINSDYEAKRYKNITLQPLEIIEAKEGLFDEWLKSEGKLGGQHKVPRLCNDRKIIEKVLQLN